MFAKIIFSAQKEQPRTFQWLLTRWPGGLFSSTDCDIGLIWTLIWRSSWSHVATRSQPHVHSYTNIVPFPDVSRDYFAIAIRPLKKNVFFSPRATQLFIVCNKARTALTKLQKSTATCQLWRGLIYLSGKITGWKHLVAERRSECTALCPSFRANPSWVT